MTFSRYPTFATVSMLKAGRLRRFGEFPDLGDAAVDGILTDDAAAPAAIDKGIA
jgi:hypothetical protein